MVPTLEFRRIIFGIVLLFGKTTKTCENSEKYYIIKKIIQFIYEISINLLSCLKFDIICYNMLTVIILTELILNVWKYCLNS